MTLKTILAACCCALIVGSAVAKSSDAAFTAPDASNLVPAVTIERSVHLRENQEYLTRDVAFPGRWNDDGQHYVYRKTVAGGFAFVSYDPATGTKAPAFDQAALAQGLGKALGSKVDPWRLPFDTFHFVDGGHAIAFEMDEHRWRCGLASDACAAKPSTSSGEVRDLDSGVVRDLKVPVDNHPRQSPDGRWEAHVQAYNLAIRPIGGAWQLYSNDGSAADFYDPESIHWSPDSRKLVAYRVTPGYRRIVYKVQSSPTDQLQPKLIAQLYPKPGDAVDIERPVLFHVDEAKAIQVATTLFPNPYDMQYLAWRKDSASFSFVYEQRGHQLARVISVDAVTGTAHAAISETAKTFINEGRRFLWQNDDGNQLIWMSERSGWNQLYLFDGKSGAVLQPITKGPWVVREVLAVDPAARQIYFLASGMDPAEDPYFQHFYRIDFDGSHLTALAPEQAYHDVALAPDLKTFVDTYSRVDLPPIAELRRSSDGKVIATLEHADISRLLDAGFKAPDPFVAKGRDGHTDIYGLIVKPHNFDPSRHYPVIENIYAGPHDSFVPKTWWPFGYHAGGDKVIGMQSLADLGFVVVQIDGMGTLNRSKAFHDVAWKNLADAGFPDRIRWHQAAAARFPWYDISHGVGIYGGSAGGQDTLSGLLFHSDFYTVGVAFAGCYDNRMDKISWNEQWMGWPVDASYAASSDVTNASRLKGKLLMIVGEQDENVDPSSTLQVVNALINAGKLFEMLMVPNGEHSVGRSTGPIDYLQRKEFEFFLHNLAGKQTPDWNALPAAS